jgi:PAS domain S-box-containing protein
MQYDGLIEAFEENKDSEIELHMDFLDSKQFSYVEIKNIKYRSIKYKIEHSRPYDYIITADDNALRFILDYRQELFKDIPVVFFGVNNVDLALQMNTDPLITGFIEDISYTETLEAITKMLPELEELYILHDETASGSADYNRIRALNSEIDQFNFRYISLNDFTFDELYDRISGLSVNQPLLLLSAFKDREGSVLSFQDSVKQLTRHCGSPVFHLWGHGIGEGLIGGKVVDHSYFAQLSAHLVLELIKGADISTYEVSRESRNRYLFDSAILEKFHISKRSLPPESTLINNNPVFSETARRYIVYLVIIIIILAAGFLTIFSLYHSKSLAESRIRILNRKLEKEKESLATTLRSIGDAVIATDCSCNITFINDVTAELTGWGPDEVFGKQLEEVFKIVNEYTGERCENPAKKVIESGKSVELANHTCLISRNRTRYVIEDSAAPIKDHNGKLLGVIIVFRDTTEKKQLLESANRTQKLESLGVLAGGIAHDFNNYLGGVIGFVELAQSRLPDSEKKVQTYLNKVLDVSGKAISLTRQLLTFSKGGSPKIEISNLRRVIFQSAEFALSGSNAIPEFSVDTDLWNCNCDINQISQCIDNLVLNAIHAMPDGGTISISASNAQSIPSELEQIPHILIQIRDTGTGIPLERLNKIFDPFYSTKEKGHGLGLATVFSIVNNHNGTVKVESEVGSGSVFSIYLPALPGTEISGEEGDEQKLSGSGEILILDDQEYILEVLGEMLSELGFSVKTALNSREAFDILKQDLSGSISPKIRACIIDQTIPGDLPGHKIAAEIKQMAPDLPLIASSGYTDEYVMSHPQEYDFNASIQKPFRITTLSEILGKCLQEYS